MSELQLTGFELIEKIGEGGMGHVWKARQLSLDRIVAIKVLPPRFSNNPESVRQIIQEARIAAKLKHPSIVQVYDANEQSGTFYFVMEYVDGYNVGHWVARKKQLGWKDAMIVVESVASALNYAWHTSQLIHCDLKLENIMVDQDGTIKVADMGLSLTQDTKSMLQDDEVAGTPGYIAPEQVLGDKKLDCRADIYALGCCLYHMVTGNRPFHELKDSEAMEAQVSSYIPDPRESVPSIPGPVCSLIERMLVKNPEQRIKDWQAVLADVHRVQRGLAPLGAHPDENASTMKRRQVVAAVAKDEAVTARASGKGGGRFAVAALAVIAVAAGAAGYYGFKHRSVPKPQEVSLPPTHVPGTNTIGPKVASKPTPPAVVKPVADANSEGLRHALEEIQRVTDGYVEEGNYAEAIHWLEVYFGRWAEATATNRAVLLAELKRKSSELEAEHKVVVAWQGFVTELSGSVLTGKYALAKQTADSAQKDALLATHRDEIQKISDILAGVGALNDRLLETFSKDVGKVVSIPLTRGEFTGRVVEIRDRKLACRTLDGAAEVDIRIEDVAAPERMRRLTAIDSPESCLVRGVGLLNEGKPEEAVPLLARTGPVLGPILVHAVQSDNEAARKAVMATDEALMGFLGILKKTGKEPGVFDPAQWRTFIVSLHLSKKDGQAIEKDLDAFLAAQSMSSFVVQNPLLILELQKAIGKADDAAEEVPAAADTPDQGEFDRFAAAFVKVNPAVTLESIVLEGSPLPGKIAVRITSGGVRDLSPVADNKNVVALLLENASGHGEVLDLGPLASSALRQLSISGYEIGDPGRMRGIRLTRLAIPSVTVKSLAFLQGMPLTNLDIRGTGISDLTSLQGMRLESLHAENTRVASVTPLAGMPLRELGLKGTQIRDVTYLQGMPLERLDLSSTPVVDFTPLRGFKLTTLNLAETGVRDLVMCTDMPLTDLDIHGTSLPSLAPLAGKTFKRLMIGDASIKDLSAFRLFKVSYLDLSGTKISASLLNSALSQTQFDDVVLANAAIDRIDFLRASRNLHTLNLSGVKVGDISPLAGLPIETLNLKGVPTSDIGTLHSMTALRSLQIDIRDQRLLAIIKHCPKLAQINGRSVRAIVDEISALLIPAQGGQ